jgi:BNR repeat-like domain
MKRVGLSIGALVIFLFASAARAEWTAAKRLSSTSGYSRDPAIAANASGIYVVWQDDTPGNNEIYFKKSTDGGAAWRPIKRLTWTAGDTSYPDVAVDSSGNIHVVWNDDPTGNNEIYYKMSTDGGATWTATKRLTWNSGYSYCPSLVSDPSSHLHLAWADYTSGNEEIYYKKSIDGGATWTSSRRLTWNSGGSGYPSIGAGPYGKIHVVWEDDTPGKYEAFYKRSTDGGTTWETSRQISSISGEASYPVLAVDPSANIHAVWAYNISGNYEIYYNKGSNAGAGWASSRRLTWTSGLSDFVDLAADASGHIHVVWHDNTPGNFEIYYKNSVDGGASWTASQRLTWNSGASDSPAIVADPSGNLHVVWSDNTPGNFEVFYKKFIK